MKMISVLALLLLADATPEACALTVGGTAVCPVLHHDPVKDCDDLVAIALRLARLSAGARGPALGAGGATSAEDVHQLARLLHRRQRVSEARVVEVLYRQALRLSPIHVGALCNYGMLLQHSFHNLSAAQMLYKSAEALNATSCAIQHNLAVLAQATGHLDEAESRFKTVLASDATFVPSLFCYAAFLADHRHDYEHAESLYTRALDQEPENVDMLCSVATFLHSRGKVAEPRRLILKAKALAPENRNVMVLQHMASLSDDNNWLPTQETPSGDRVRRSRKGVRMPASSAQDRLLRERRRSAAVAEAVAAAVQVATRTEKLPVCQDRVSGTCALPPAQVSCLSEFRVSGRQKSACQLPRSTLVDRAPLQHDSKSCSTLHGVIAAKRLRGWRRMGRQRLKAARWPIAMPPTRSRAPKLPWTRVTTAARGATWLGRSRQQHTS